MRSKVIRIAVAAVLALVGCVVLIRYVESARDEAVEGEVVVPVLVVKATIPKDTPASELEGRVQIEQVPEKVRAEGAVSDLADLQSLHTNVELVPGEQVVKGRFVKPGEAARGIAPPGMLQITINLDPERALGGLVRPGDRVRIVLLEGETQGTTPPVGAGDEFKDILVTKVQADSVPSGETSSDGVDEAPSGNLWITLATDSVMVGRIANAKAENRIWLSAEPETKTGAAEASAAAAPAGGAS